MIKQLIIQQSITADELYQIDIRIDMAYKYRDSTLKII